MRDDVVDVVEYWPVRPQHVEHVLEVVPEALQCAVDVHVNGGLGITVDASRREVIAWLDTYLVERSGIDFTKAHRVEVGVTHLDMFDYYEITPTQLELGPFVHFDVDNNLLPLQPIQVHPQTVPTIGEVWGPWPAVYLVIKRSVYDALDQIGAQGLQCWPTTNHEVLLAKIVPLAWEVGARLVVSLEDEYGRVTVGAADSATIRREDVDDYDFVAITCMTDGRTTKQLHRPRWLVSRRVVRALLKTARRGLERTTWTLNEKFRPYPDMI